MADILEIITLLFWIALGVYTFHHTRRMNKRLDSILDEVEKEIGP